MRKIVKTLNVTAFLMLLGILISSFDPTYAPVINNKGVDIEVMILKGKAAIGINCGDNGTVWYEAKAGKVQYKDGEIHVYDFVVQLPLDNCVVPTKEEGTYMIEIEGGTMLFNPSGKVIYKRVDN